MPGGLPALIRLPGAIAARFMLARYLLASICALCADLALFLTLDRIGAPPMLAACGGYAAGLIIHWIISVRFVFHGGRETTHAQRLGFVVSALLGMGITIAMVGSLTVLGLTPAAAKLISVSISFFIVYAIRKYGLFAIT